MSTLIKAVTENIVIDASERFGYIIDKPSINENILFIPIDIALRDHAEKQLIDAKDSDYTLDFLNIWLEDFRNAKDRRRAPMGLHGMQSGEFDSSSKNALKMFRAVPVDLIYSITLWTKSRERVEAFLQECVFWQFSNPFIDLFYEDNKSLRYPVLIEENTDLANTVAEMYTKGKYYNYTAKAKVEAWVIKDLSYLTIKKIILDIYADDGKQTKSAENFIEELTVQE